MANDLKFVDSVATSPTTLLDLNDRAVGGFWLDDLQAPAPSLRRGLSDAILTDGQIMSSSAYDNRSITLGLRMFGTSDQTALAIQKLGRILNAPQSVLRWLPQGSTLPVFFRVLRSPISAVDESLQMKAQDTRRLDVELLADPAAYGLPETGSVTINNDPAAGSNPMFWDMPTIKGDLESPLFLTAAATTDLAARVVYMASQALGFGKSMTAPRFIQSNDAATSVLIIGASGAWTTGSADAAMSAGNYRRFTSNGTAGGASMTATGILSGALPGDYRVIVRVRTGDASTDWGVYATQQSTGASTDTIEGKHVHWKRQGANLSNWLDLGVFRIPYAAPPADPIFGTQPATGVSTFIIGIDVPALASKTIDIDCVMFVPAGLDHAVVTRTSFTGFPLTQVGSISTAAVFDGLNDVTYVLDTSGLVGGRAFVARNGALPTVLPGYDNSLHYVRHLGQGYDPLGAQVPDVLTATTPINWQYWPKYLYVRPAST